MATREEWADIASKAAKEILGMDDFAAHRFSQQFADEMLQEQAQYKSKAEFTDLALQCIGRLLGIDPVEIQRKRKKFRKLGIGGPR